jgi:hypothetical protein
MRALPGHGSQKREDDRPRSPECDASDLMFATTNTPEGLSPDRPGHQITPWIQVRIETAVAIPARKDTGPPEFMEHNIHDGDLRLRRPSGEQECAPSQVTGRKNGRTSIPARRNIAHRTNFA